jgi:hypothetical protein
MSESNQELASLLSKAIADSLVNRDLPRIEFYNGDQNQNINKWLQNYEMQAKARSWDDQTKMLKVGAYLRDSALDFYKI